MDQVAALKATLKSTTPGRLQDKVAIVTGGASGIGRAICVDFAREGAHLVVADLNPASRDSAEAAVATHELISRAGAKASFHRLDVTQRVEFDTTVHDTVAQYGRLDILVNNAGVAPNAAQGSECPIWDSTDGAWDMTMSVNAKGVWNGTRAAAKMMVGQEPGPGGDRGWIVNLASVYGLVGATSIGAYVASKHACMGVTKSAALDCAPRRVHVNAICPGWTKTNMTHHVWSQNQETEARMAKAHPFRGLGYTEDIAPAAVFLASEDAKWMTGVGLSVDGGFICQ